MSKLLIESARFERKIDTFGYEFLAFQTRVMAPGESHSENTGGRELAIVLLGGHCTVSTPDVGWSGIGGRAHVFAGKPHTVYIPINTSFEVIAEADGCDLAFCYAKAEEYHPPRLVTPDEVDVEIRGGGNATRQIHGMLKPGFPSHRLVVVEVYTPSGNWSSYPPHKHDVHAMPGEADLEEIYYYRIDRPEGFAIQKVYTGDRRIDETITVRSGELVLVPEGYHPVVAAHGYNAYYLNALAGSAQSLAATDDPAYAWVRDTWTEQDPRLPWKF